MMTRPAKPSGEKPRKEEISTADLLRLLARGLSITEIARRRGVPRTTLARELRRLAAAPEGETMGARKGTSGRRSPPGGAASDSRDGYALFAAQADTPARGPGHSGDGVLSLVAYTDGASRGNPGPSGIGVVLMRDGQVLAERGQPIGQATNNVAEYSAVLAALEMARTYGAHELEIRLDSELVVRQLTGVYRVRDPRLAELAQKAMALSREVGRVRWVHVPRSQNARADALANQALDAAAGSAKYLQR